MHHTDPSKKKKNVNELDYVSSHSVLSGRALFSTTLGEDAIEIREHLNLRWLHINGDGFLSMMDVNNPTIPVQPHTKAMLGALLLKRYPHRILNIGVGGGAFERFFKHHLSDAQISSIEEQELIASLARQYFQLPNGHPVVINTAQEFLETNSQQYDLLLCDIVNGDQNPACLFDLHFHKAVYRALQHDGIFALNFLRGDEDQLINLLVTARRVFSTIGLLGVKDHKNMILLGLRQAAKLDLSQLQLNSEQLHKRTGLDLRFLLNDLQWLDKSEIDRTP